ncbi:MAG: VanZ family protein [Planctomycetales bacterium]|nr:VanZ family protein [Planctomycetales bacterium]MCB0058295.1 VanZ family protein [Caldilineaceae bacterium]
MTTETKKKSVRLHLTALWVVLLINVVSYWYPFTLDLPRWVTNTAQRQPDGTWNLDGDSLITGYAPDSVVATIASGQFRLAVKAKPALPNQHGPARLFAIGHTPYDPSFMIGIEGDNIVLRLPCGAAASDIDAEWKVSMQGKQDIVVTLWFQSLATGFVSFIQVANDPPVQMENHCPGGALPRLPDAKASWTLGNVESGHRPFMGQIVKLELAGDGHLIDLLRNISWQVPVIFWIWPERLYQPAGGDLLATLWHFAGFVPLGYLVDFAGQIYGPPQVLTSIFAFATALNGGKLLIMGRHPSIIDLLLNVAGALAGFFARQRLASKRKLP